MAKKSSRRGLGAYTDNDPGLRRDSSVDRSGNPVAKPRELLSEVESTSGNGFSRAIE